ncbi:UNVERIFIED_CONTAM: hypothetical protein GTU68_006493, partial [Idotea baltica]|nr:hypothetical protein [Idotea baltica]
MNIEIERKFLIKGHGWKVVEPTIIRQGYLNTDKARSVRVRIYGEEAFLAIKGLTEGISRSEYEYSIPMPDAHELLKLCVDTIIEKKRYILTVDDVVW